MNVIILPFHASLAVSTRIPETVCCHLQLILSGPLLHRSSEHHVLEVLVMIQELLHTLLVSLRYQGGDQCLIILLGIEDLVADVEDQGVCFVADVAKHYAV